MTDDDLDSVPSEDDALPSSVRVSSRDGDAWYEYDGERLFDPDTIRSLWGVYQRMEDTDWERVQGMRDPSVKLKVRTKDVGDLQADLEAAWEDANDDAEFLYNRPGLLGGHHGVHEEGPRKSVAWADYKTGRAAGLGGAKYKRRKLLLPVRSYEQWRFHNDVWLPVVEEYNEKYPY